MELASLQCRADVPWTAGKDSGVRTTLSGFALDATRRRRLVPLSFVGVQRRRLVDGPGKTGDNSFFSHRLGLLIPDSETRLTTRRKRLEAKNREARPRLGPIDATNHLSRETRVWGPRSPSRRITDGFGCQLGSREAGSRSFVDRHSFELRHAFCHVPSRVSYVIRGAQSICFWGRRTKECHVPSCLGLFKIARTRLTSGTAHADQAMMPARCSQSQLSHVGEGQRDGCSWHASTALYPRCLQ